MAYKLRFVQRFQEGEREAFLRLERQFAALERENPAFPKGRRYLPYSGREPGNTLIWECEFPSLADAQAALDFLGGDPQHEALYAQQSVFFLEAYTEIYRTLDE